MMNDLTKHIVKTLIESMQQSCEEELYNLAMKKASLEEGIAYVEQQAQEYEKILGQCERVLEDIGYEVQH